MLHGSGSWIRTNDLRVMSPTSYRCSIPRRRAESNDTREADGDRSCWRGKARRVVVEPSALSTASLQPLPAFHVRPIHPVVYRGPYPLEVVGNLIWAQASRLDAFSAYPDRTSATQPCSWRNNWYTGGPSIPVLSY